MQNPKLDFVAGGAPRHQLASFQQASDDGLRQHGRSCTRYSGISNRRVLYVNVSHFADKYSVEHMIEQMGFNATILRRSQFTMPLHLLFLVIETAKPSTPHGVRGRRPVPCRVPHWPVQQMVIGIEAMADSLRTLKSAMHHPWCFSDRTSTAP